MLVWTCCLSVAPSSVFPSTYTTQANRIQANKVQFMSEANEKKQITHIRAPQRIDESYMRVKYNGLLVYVCGGSSELHQ